MTWLIVVWWVLGIGSAVHSTKQENKYIREHFDLRHCSYQSMATVCLPLDGCWISDYNGAATCYRRSELAEPVAPVRGQP